MGGVMISGIAFGKEMEDTIDIGGVADIAHFYVEIDEPVQFVHFHRKGRSIWQMVNQSVDLAQVNGIGKNSFHVGQGIQSKKMCVSLSRFGAEKT
jgi:hypothetical protein